MSTTPICFQYVDGPEHFNVLEVEVDSTKIGSYLPTQLRYVVFLYKGKEAQTVAKSLIDVDTVYATVKHSPMVGSPITLTQGVKLDNRAKYDIKIGNDKKVTFIKKDESCN